MHGGTILVESRIGGGSRFAVTLPADPRLVAGTPAAARADVASAADAAARVDPTGAADAAGFPASSSAGAKMAETSPSEGSQVNVEAPP
jgi:hypothetical protein